MGAFSSMQLTIKANFEKLKSAIDELYAKSLETSDLVRWTEGDRDPVEAAISAMNRGHIRAAQKIGDSWVVNEWVKKAILLYFRLNKVIPMEIGPMTFVDKIPLKKWKGNEGVRVVPPAVVRFGAFVGTNCVLMPSFVNIGAYVGEGSMVDTWATVGSCAQIGREVHLSGGVGIGGVLEPLQATPVIIEDHVFVGSRAIIVEGVIIEEGSVIAAGVVLTSSTKIIDVSGDKATSSKGRIPAGSVVIPGVIPKEFPGGSMGVPCATIIGKRSAGTDKKTSLNQALREFELSV
jgi:2,3,4,5-tetrahydropyridine-2,6-dicarboxylate N-succinyltransferase